MSQKIWEGYCNTVLAHLSQGSLEDFIVAADGTPARLQCKLAAEDGADGRTAKSSGFSVHPSRAPVAFSNYLAVGDADGYLHILAQSDGRILGRRKLDSKGLRSGMVYAQGILFVYGNSGSLHAIEITEKS